MKFVITFILLVFYTTISFAGSPTYNVRAAGDLKVDGTLYLKDGTPIVSSDGLLKNRGNFISGTSYFSGDVVQSGGSSYVCKATNVGQPLTNDSTYWAVMATQGATGTDGVTPSVTSEAPGSNCTYGGTKIQVGANTPQYVCNGAGALVDYSGTYEGVESVFIVQSAAQVMPVTLTLVQSGTSLTGTMSGVSNGGPWSGTISGTLSGSFFSMESIINQTGCTSNIGSGMGMIQNNKMTFFGNSTVICDGITSNVIMSGVLTKK